MKKLLLILLSTVSVSTMAYTTYFSDGSYAQTFGNTTYYSDGSYAQTF